MQSKSLPSSNGAEDVPVGDRGHDAFLEQELQNIKNGSHKEILELESALQRALERRIATADRFRKLHIHNANQLYDYEVADANAVYQRSVEDTKERIATETAAAHRDQLRHMEQARADNEDDDRSEAGGPRGAGQSTIRTRRTADPQEVEEASRGDGKKSKGASGSKRQTDRALNAVLGETLPDEAVRADFVAIVRDMEQRADKVTAQYKSKLELDVSVLYDVLTITGPPAAAASLAEAAAAQQRFTVGSFVNVFSALTQEDYAGIITSITSEDVVIRLGTGTRLRVFVQQIRDHRIVMRVDYESSKDIETITAAKRMKLR